MAESLNPTLISRVAAALHTDWVHSVPVRRVAAGGLVVLAGVAAVRPDPAGKQVDVVVTTHDIGPGTALTADDVSVQSRLAATIPDGAAVDPATVLGARLAGPARRGEVLTDLRMLGRHLTEAAAGPDARIVPVHPNDSALADLLHPGDVVDVVAAAQTDPGVDSQATPRVVAAGGVVVLVSGDRRNTTDDRVVLVALPAAAATAVAGATLVQPVTLTLH